MEIRFDISLVLDKARTASTLNYSALHCRVLFISFILLQLPSVFAHRVQQTNSSVVVILVLLVSILAPSYYITTIDTPTRHPSISTLCHLSVTNSDAESCPNKLEFAIILVYRFVIYDREVGTEYR
jgi:hypothetical protein